MKIVAVGCWPAFLVATLHLTFLHLGGSVIVKKRRSPPKKNILGTLRAALASRTEELHNQQNIAHGLQLEVRELQSEVQAEKQAVAKEQANAQASQVKALQTELQAEKQALAKESADKQALQFQLNRVRAVVLGAEDARSSKASPPVPSGVASSSQREGANNAQDHTAAATAEVAAQPVQTLEESVRDMQAQNDTLDETVRDVQAADTELESPEDIATPQEQASTPKVAPVVQEQPSTPKVAPVVQEQPSTPKVAPAVQEQPSAPKVAPTVPPPPTQQQLSQEQPPAPKAVPVAPPQGTKPSVAARPTHTAKAMAKLTPATKPPTPQLRASGAPPQPSAGVSDAGSSKGAEASADFDALEAQLHEEDRRIQDLDRENALDAMSDSGGAGGQSATPPAVPAAVPSPVATSNPTPAKAVPAQPKLALDAEAPMEDLLNVEVPGPEPTAEAAISSAPADALALPQISESVGAGLDGALSDEKFLSQMATTARH